MNRLGQDFLLEIGLEELPAGSQNEARLELLNQFKSLLQDQRLSCDGVEVYGAPRRLAVLAYNLSERQEDLVRESRGPAAKVAFDQDGQPTRAAQGFAKGQGVAVDDLVTREGYVYATKREAGQPTLEVMPLVLPKMIEGLHFPKFMRWGDKNLRFIRPIRWLVALYGAAVVSFSIAGVTSGRCSRGHRFLHPDMVELQKAGSYLNALAKAYVIADPEQRRTMIEKQLLDLAALEKGQVIIEEELLNEVNNLVEYPTAILGSYDTKHLALPDEVLTTVMADHQRYFPVRGADGHLAARFIGVRDGGDKGLDQVRTGYERVLEARLEDATFFFREDLKESLAAKAERLKEVIFQESLGSMWDKSCRLQYLARWICGVLDLPKDKTDTAAKAASLAKADLVTSMVFEFPELQGIMGSYYAARHGESDAVARTIREHYLPRFAGDALPDSEAGTVLALADKLDTLVGYWSVGIRPTGSADPYGQRRLANSICVLLIDKGLDLSWKELLLQAYGQFEAFGMVKMPFENLEKSISEFYRMRLGNILEERGIRYDVVNAVLASGWDKPSRAARRAAALQGFLVNPALEPLVTTYTRARNLSKESTGQNIRPELFVDSSESALYQSLNEAREQVGVHLQTGNYEAALIALASLETPLANFFDQVLVMAEDPEIRTNRLALLRGIVDCVGQIADLAQIQ